MKRSDSPLRIEVGQELPAGQALALDGAGNVLARLRFGVGKVPGAARVVRLSLEDFERFEAFARSRLKSK
jgi:hypothetical protein